MSDELHIPKDDCVIRGLLEDAECDQERLAKDELLRKAVGALRMQEDISGIRTLNRHRIAKKWLSKSKYEILMNRATYPNSQIDHTLQEKLNQLRREVLAAAEEIGVGDE